MRESDPRIGGRFWSVDPLTKKYPGLSPYQFGSNSPIANVDLDGGEAKVAFTSATITKDRSQIEIKASIDITIKIINLSGRANSDFDLQNLALNLGSDLQSRLGGNHTANTSIPYTFKSSHNHVDALEPTKPGQSLNYSTTYNTSITTDIQPLDQFSKIDKDVWVFAIVDNITNVAKDGETVGLADVKGGKVAIGEAQYFTGDNASEGRQLIFHEILHLLGAEDTYAPNVGLPGTNNKDNVMFSVTPNSGRKLTPEQVIQEIMPATVGGVVKLFVSKTYSQPRNENSNTTTQQELKTFIKENGNATQLENN